MPIIDQPYYPALSDLLTIDDLPASLSFIKGELSDIFNNIYAHVGVITNMASTISSGERSRSYQQPVRSKSFIATLLSGK